MTNLVAVRGMTRDEMCNIIRASSVPVNPCGDCDVRDKPHPDCPLVELVPNLMADGAPQTYTDKKQLDEWDHQRMQEVNYV